MAKISIISPCFNEQENILACYESIQALFANELPDYQYEHIFTDNSSSDSTVDILRDIASKDSRVKVILNARNYGPFKSTFNALKNASGHAVLVMLPVDLQDPPSLIATFVKHWEDGAKIVCGQRIQREENILWRMARRIYYRTVKVLANIDIPMNAAEFQLIDRSIVDALISSNDAYPYIRGMIANCGFSDKTVMVPYTWRKRKGGCSKNRLYHLFDQGMNGIISFTNVPLRLSTFMGFTVSVFSMVYAVLQLLINILAPGPLAQPGIPTLIVAIFFFSGIQLFFIGLLGEYVGAIHQQVRRGSEILVREKINFTE